MSSVTLYCQVTMIVILGRKEPFSYEDDDTLPLITLLRIGKSVHIRVPAFFILYLIKTEMKTIDQRYQNILQKN